MLKSVIQFAKTLHRAVLAAFMFAACVGLLLMGYIGYQMLHITHSSIQAAGAQMKEDIPGIATRFSRDEITRTFKSGIPEVTSTRGDILEVATARNVELFTRANSRSLFWDAVYLGTTISEIKVPVTFRYHIRLSDTWHLVERDGVCYVMAPAIRPSQPPAIHTDGMEKSTSSGWARFNKEDNLLVLERSLTPLLEQRAEDQTMINQVREAGRLSVAEFVRSWLMREEHWREDRFQAIVVVFPDEVPLYPGQKTEIGAREPTLRL